MDQLEHLDSLTSDLTTQFDTVSDHGSAALAEVASLDERLRAACEELTEQAHTLKSKLATLQHEHDEHWTALETQRDRVVRELGDLGSALTDGTEALATMAGTAEQALREFHEWCTATQSEFDATQPDLDSAFEALSDAARAADDVVTGAYGGLNEALQSVRQAVDSQRQALDEQLQQFEGLVSTQVQMLESEVSEFVTAATDHTSELAEELERLATSQVQATSTAVRQGLETALMQEVRPLIDRAAGELKTAIQEIVRSMTDDTSDLKNGGNHVRQLMHDLEGLQAELEEAARSAEEFIRQAEERIRDASSFGLL
jgi:chromosome segregation ATPase